MENFRRFFSSLLIISLLFGSPLTSFSQQRGNIGGMVFTETGAPSAGVGILVNNTAGETVTRAITDQSGAYLIQDLPLGQYNMTLDPLMTNVKGDTIVADLGPEGLTVNWTVSASAPALVAKTSPAPYQSQHALTTNQKIALAGLSTLITGGIVTGSLALAGFFHDPIDPAAFLVRVRDAEGNPLSDANVTVRGSFGTCTTGGNGTCAIRGFKFEGNTAQVEVTVTNPDGTQNQFTTDFIVDSELGQGVNSGQEQVAVDVQLNEDGSGNVRITSGQRDGQGGTADETTIVEVENNTFNPVSPSI